MISIIICCRRTTISKTLHENIESSIGCAFELIIIDNSNNKYSIFSAYNEGVSRAKYQYLCFMHEDILYHSKNWGQKLINHFKESEYSMIGIAGVDYILKIPGIYSPAGNVYWNLLQSNSDGTNTKHFYNNPNKISIRGVNAIDGLWFCVKKELFDVIKFDEEKYSGFHFYDFDLSMQVINDGYKIGVIYDVLIEHFSYGTKNQEWLSNNKIFLSKWAAFLPVGIEKVDKNTYKDMMRTGLLQYKSILEINHYSDHDIDKFVRKYFSSIFIKFNREFIRSLIRYYLFGSKMFNLIKGKYYKR